jgi:hypothetical protein
MGRSNVAVMAALLALVSVAPPVEAQVQPPSGAQSRDVPSELERTIAAAALDAQARRLSPQATQALMEQRIRALLAAMPRPELALQTIDALLEECQRDPTAVARRFVITLFDGVSYAGDSVTVYDEENNLTEVNFDNRARSARSATAWLLCEDADFRGRCERVNATVDDLASIRLSLQLSSLRSGGRDVCGGPARAALGAVRAVITSPAVTGGGPAPLRPPPTVDGGGGTSDYRPGD